MFAALLVDFVWKARNKAVIEGKRADPLLTSQPLSAAFLERLAGGDLPATPAADDTVSGRAPMANVIIYVDASYKDGSSAIGFAAQTGSGSFLGYLTCFGPCLFHSQESTIHHAALFQFSNARNSQGTPHLFPD